MTTRPGKRPDAAPRARERTATARRARAEPAGSTLESLRDEVLALKRERILREAATLFYERGYMQTTMDAIAERMGATKPFVYYHYRSKVEILVEICERGTADALAAVDAVLKRPDPPLARFEAFVREFTRVALTNHEFVAIYFREGFSLPAESTERINAMRKSIDRKLRGLLTEGAARGDVEIEDAGITALVIEGMSSYAFAWYRDRGRLGPDRVTELIVAMALKMVRARSTV